MGSAPSGWSIISVREGEVHSIIGPNGAGKTTIFNVVSGVYPRQRARSSSRDGRHQPRPYQIARLGLARTFQNIYLFPI